MKKFLMGISLVICAVVGVILAPGVMANHPLNLIPNPNAWGPTVPGDIYSDMRNSNHGANHPAYFTWLSPEANTAASSMTVNFSQNEANLRLNLAGVVSRIPNQAVRAKYRITDVSGGGPQGNSQGPGSFRVGAGNLIGQERTIVFEPNENQLGRYEYEKVTFQFKPGDPDGAGPLNGFVREGRYNITIWTKLIARFKRSDGSFVHRCVPTEEQVPSLDHHHLCPETGWPLTIDVTINPEPNYDNESLLRLCGSQSPVNGEVVPGGTYRLCARSTNQGPQPTLGVFTLGVRKLTANTANAGIGDLTPAGKRVSVFGNEKIYLSNNSGCSPSGTASPEDCWAWFFQDIPAQDEVNTDFNFRVNNNAPIGSSQCFRPFVRRRAPSGPGSQFHQGNQMCFTVVDPNCPVGSDFAGQLIASQLDRNGDGTINNQDCNNPPVKKYLRVYGNDIMAGGDFGSGCSARDAAAGIRAYSQSQTIASVTDWKGASSQFGAFALGAIDGFFSANMRGPISGAGLPRPPLDLTFGNTTNGTTKVGVNEGGSSGISNCTTDYFALGAATATAGGTIGTVGTSITVPEGSHQAHYYTGNVYIRGNGIVFQDSATGSTWGGSTDTIPSYYLIVKGNIYIDPAVTQLDGVYIAQPLKPGDPGYNAADPKGEIITCANASGPITSLGGCTNKLTVNGSFIARQVRFLRTTGDLLAAQPNEGAGSPNIAEVFNFSPEVYLSPLHPSLRTNLPFTKYDYITSLPPVL